MIISKWRTSSPASKVVGQLDQVDDSIVRGWVFDPSRPTKRLTVDVFCKSLFLGQATAGFARPDLETAGFGDGRFQFLMHLPATPKVTVNEIVVTVSQYPEVEITAKGAVLRKVRGTERSSTKDELQGMLAPLLRSDGSDLRSCNARSGNPSLLTSSLVFGVPLSAFAQHIASKFGWPRGWKQTDFDRFLDWYVSEYAVSQAPRRVPWSDEEIAFWSDLVSHRHVVCRASQRFSPRAPGLSRAHAAYAWAVEDSRRLFVEDIFVHSSLGAFLRSVPVVNRWRRFPLSRFMILFLAENERFRHLPRRNVAERQVIYAAIMLYGLALPHLLTYIPRRWLTALLDDRSGGQPFRKALTKLGLQTPEHVADEYIQKLERRGYDVQNQRWAHPDDEGTAPAANDPRAFDVQLIGPLTQTLGLGESARRIAAALMQCGVSVNLVDHDLGNASPRQSPNLPLGVVSLAKITILHLNLEEIPEALSYLHTIKSRSYLVAFPYFELNAPSAAHELGARMVQEIWVASTFLHSVFHKVCEQTYLIGMPARTRLSEITSQQETRLQQVLAVSETFTFLATADALSWIQRKNLLGVLDAFQAAFDAEGTVRLLIKTHNRALAAGKTDDGLWPRVLDRVSRDQRVVLIDETFDDDTYRQLLARVDCLVSLHRAEGLGLDLLDAMGMGTAVVATAYSGNSDFCDRSICWPIPFDLVEIRPGTYPYAEAGHLWANPRLDEAVESLRHVFHDALEREARTERAAKYIAAAHSMQAVSGRIASRLRDAGLPAAGRP